MNLELFYYNQLASTQKKIYVHLLKHFLEKHLGLPYIIPIKVAKPQELLKVYNALFLDNTSSLLPAMNTIGAYRHGNKCVLTSELESCSNELITIFKDFERALGCQHQMFDDRVKEVEVLRKITTIENNKILTKGKIKK